MKATSFLLILFLNISLNAGEVNSWECSKFTGAKIIGEDGTYLGKLGPAWLSDSIFNSSSSYASSWSQNSIFNTNSIYGSSFSNASAFNEHASSPPTIFSDDNDLLGYITTSNSWQFDNYNALDFKYTCDWD